MEWAVAVDYRTTTRAAVSGTAPVVKLAFEFLVLTGGAIR